MSAADLFWLLALVFIVGPSALALTIWAGLTIAFAFTERDVFSLAVCTCTSIGAIALWCGVRFCLVQIGVLS